MRSNVGVSGDKRSILGLAGAYAFGHWYGETTTHRVNKPPKMREYRPPSWKYRELVAAFDGDANVADLIRAAGFEPPPIKTIAGWRMRNSIPAAWLPLLIQEALDRGLLDSLSQLRRAA